MDTDFKAIVDRVEELDDRIDDLVIRLSQQADAASTNLSEKLEDELKIVKFIRATVRWFVPILITIIVSLVGTGWMLGNRLHDMVQNNDARLVALENRSHSFVTHKDLSIFKDQILDILAKLRLYKEKYIR